MLFKQIKTKYVAKKKLKEVERLKSNSYAHFKIITVLKESIFL